MRRQKDTVWMKMRLQILKMKLYILLKLIEAGADSVPPPSLPIIVEMDHI